MDAIANRYLTIWMHASVDWTAQRGLDPWLQPEILQHFQYTSYSILASATTTQYGSFLSGNCIQIKQSKVGDVVFTRNSKKSRLQLRAGSSSAKFELVSMRRKTYEDSDELFSMFASRPIPISYKDSFIALCEHRVKTGKLKAVPELRFTSWRNESEPSPYSTTANSSAKSTTQAPRLGLEDEESEQGLSPFHVGYVRAVVSSACPYRAIRSSRRGLHHLR